MDSNRIGRIALFRGTGAARWFQEFALYFLLAICAVTFSKGAINYVQSSAQGYWFINYSHGILRRALPGQVVSLFRDQSNPTKVLNAVLYVHWSACILLVVGLWVWLRAAARTGDAGLLLAMFSVFATSQFLPTQAYDTGFLDVYNYILVSVAAFAAMRKSWGAAVIGLIGPLIHEGFVFVWASLAILIVWESPILSWQRITTILAPLISLAIIYFSSTKSAMIAAATSLPLPQNVISEFMAFQLGQTFLSNVRILVWNILNYRLNFVMAVLFFATPTMVMVMASGFTRKSARDFVTLICATFCPVTILFVAWNLSRFIVATVYFALLSILYMQSVRPIKAARFPVVIGCWIFAALNALVPFVYAYYPVAGVVDRGPVPFASTPIGHVVTDWTIFYSRNMGPRVVPEVGNEDPPGTVWNEDEDGWINTWTRRPGTNIFDASGSNDRFVRTQYYARWRPNSSGADEL